MGDSVSDADIEDFGKRIAAAAESAASLDDLETWLRAQPGVRDLRLSKGLLKSNPPQQEFVFNWPRRGEQPAGPLWCLFSFIAIERSS